MKNIKMLHAIGEIDDELIYGAVNDTKVKKQTMHRWVKWGAIAACLCLAVVGAITIMPKTNYDKGTGVEGSGKEAVPAGPIESVMYSVAVIPADRNLDDVQNAYCEEIYQEEAQKEAGLCDYLPAESEGYHFGSASIYVTTMKDSTVYKMLRVTYTTGNNSRISPNEEGTEFAQNPNDSGDEFRISIYDFKPDTSCEIYTEEKIREELVNGNLGNGLFYIQYENYYIGIQPLSLSTEEIINLINSIGRYGE